MKVGKKLAHTEVSLQLILSPSNWRIIVPNFWWISPRNYYTDLLSHWRHNYNEYIFKTTINESSTICHKLALKVGTKVVGSEQDCSCERS